MPELKSPFAKPASDLPIRKGAPPFKRPSPEDVSSFPIEAGNLITRNWCEQRLYIRDGHYDIDWMDGEHFLFAGATGPGLGGAIATAALHILKNGGSITIVSRDFSLSVGFEMGKLLEKIAVEKGMENRFNLLNDGIALEGPGFEKIVNSLKRVRADNIIYINTVASGSSGMRPGYPTVYVKDIEEEGIFQWEMEVLNERALKSTEFIMGTMAVLFPKALEKAGFRMKATAFADWRGSLDRRSRNPESSYYGRQGPYSTSLFLSKDEIQKETSAAYGTGRTVIDVFFPVMRTRALTFIPGGMAMSYVYDRLMKKSGVRRIDIPELALGMFQQIGRAIRGEDDNPFPRLDTHESQFDLWFHEVMERLNMDPGSDFYYKKWMEI